jgi:hypothetical protein
MSADRRTAERIPISLTARCRRNGETWRARISNISLGGCCVELATKVLERGDRLAIELQDDLVLPATVAWAGNKRAGLAFASPLYSAMIEEFAQQFADATA